MHLRHRNLQNKQASIIVWSRAEPWLLRKACGLYGVEREKRADTGRVRNGDDYLDPSIASPSSFNNLVSSVFFFFETEEAVARTRATCLDLARLSRVTWYRHRVSSHTQQHKQSHCCSSPLTTTTQQSLRRKITLLIHAIHHCPSSFPSHRRQGHQESPHSEEAPC
ncbi:hypothetical protein CGCFRS4_v000382 [Colletotrichum fructicola]|nr:hypothetical protein CGCFRS4_v000382 [Colletotrichum fructicola]